MRFFGGLAAVALAACGAFGAGDAAPPTSAADAGPTDTGDASSPSIPDAAGPSDDAADRPDERDSGDDTDGRGTNRLLLQVHVATGPVLGAGPNYAISFPSPTAVTSVPMIAIAARAAPLELPTKPVSAGDAWTLVATSSDHVAIAIYTGPQGKSVSQVDFAFTNSPTDLAVLLMEWQFSSASYSPAVTSVGGASSIAFKSMTADPAQLMKQPVIVNIAAALGNNVSSVPTSGFVAVSPPMLSGSTSLVAAYYSVQDAQPHATSYTLSSGSTDYDAVSMIYVQP